MRLCSLATSGMILSALACVLNAQPPAGFGGGRGGPGRAGPAAALFDPTGYWVAQITEDWKERIHPAAKGDVGSIPVSAAGRREAAAWDPSLPPTHARFTASAEFCACPDAFTSPGKGTTSRSNPTRARRLACSLLAPERPSGGLQGVSVASWDRLTPALSGFTLGGRGGGGGSLKVVTTQAGPAISRAMACPMARKPPSPNTMTSRRSPAGPTLLVVSRGGHRSRLSERTLLVQRALQETGGCEPAGTRSRATRR